MAILSSDKDLHRIWGACRAIIGGVLIHFALGVVYTWGNMVTYVASYMRNADGMSQYSDVGFVLSIIISGQAIGMVSGGIIEPAIGPRSTVYFGGSILTLGVFLSSYLLHSYIGFILSYGLMFGLGMGICYTAPLSCALRWIPERRGLASGIITTGLGASSFVFTLAQTNFINPENLSPQPLNDDTSNFKYFTDAALLSRVPSSIWMSSCLYFLLILIGGTLLIDPSTHQRIGDGKGLPESANIEVDGLRPSLHHVRYTLESEADMTPFEAVATNRFHFLYFIFFLVAVVNTFIIGLWKLGPSRSDDMHLSLAGSIACLCNAGGRILWGQVADMTSTSAALLSLTLLWFCNLSLLALFGAASPSLYASGVCVNFLCVGGTFAVFPALTSIAFGRRFLGTIYGMLYLSQLVGSNLSSFITRRFISAIGYTGLMYLYGGFVLATFILTLIFGSHLNDRCIPISSADEKLIQHDSLEGIIIS